MTDVGVFRDAEHVANVSGITFDDVDASSPRGSADIRGQDRSRIKKLQTAAKVAFIDKALRDLDILIYCELSALYYMDCSLILLVFRAAVQLFFFTPKEPPFDPKRNQPFIGAIFVSNVICMLFHAFLVRPEVGESTRGYQHGGLFIDFIGQKPVPVIRLLIFDVFIFVVDIIMLALIIERVKTVGPKTTNLPGASENSTAANADTDAASAQANTQDHDAEERGVRNADGTSPISGSSSEHAVSNTLPTINIDTGDFDETTSLLADPSIAENASIPRGGHPLDLFASGQSIIMDMGFISTIGDQWRHMATPIRRRDARLSPQAATSLRESLGLQRFGLQMGADGRLVRITP
ncbi:Uncharacterized protein PECH_003089 [Penicillium ucsense]|uniref:DUF1746 domain-containing protein n=1 Tax=Penicillium ucsense TaxID=2839758 RepID=A0A8J8VWA8_9EURO|nr:Uncharacterized protein PECM_002730 [Penicillium ucsense]KAF7729827.1 Uncharacterized protein PECH_003089 [Penicillium ucsense]